MSLQESWWEEKRSAYLYFIIAESEEHPLRKNLFLQLAKAAEDQSKMWADKIQAPAGQLVFKPNYRTRFVGWLIRIFGVERLRFILSAMKVRGMSVFSKHEHERMHRGINTAGNLRAAVFGVNDGLISNLSLILGVAGANAEPKFIVLAGVAGLLAGAFSMGTGEFVSVGSQRDVFKHQIQLEKDELELYPEEEMEELALIYEARGIPKEDATKLSELLIRNPKTALDTLAREELGLNPDELGSPMGAMLSSFFSFALGAFIPMLPFFMPLNAWQLYWSIGLSGLTLFFIGAVLSLFTNRNAWLGGFKMLLIGAASGAITFGIGRLLGVAFH